MLVRRSPAANKLFHLQTCSMDGCWGSELSPALSAVLSRLPQRRSVMCRPWQICSNQAECITFICTTTCESQSFADGGALDLRPIEPPSRLPIHQRPCPAKSSISRPTFSRRIARAARGLSACLGRSATPTSGQSAQEKKPDGDRHECLVLAWIETDFCT